MALTVLDPTREGAPADRPLAEPLDRGAPARIALVDINKPRGDVFLDELEAILADRGHATERMRKPTFTRIAPADLRREIATRCDAVIEALAD